MTSPSPESSLSRPVSGVVSPRQVRSRTQSISSDRPSTIGLSLGLSCPPASVSPEAAFIAASAASQIVTNDHDSHSNAWYDRNSVEPCSEPAIVSPPALLLVNGFLDQLLFNFLQVSRSTALSALRPAVCEILKPKLAKDAIGIADDELREYLGGAEENESSQSAAAAPRAWDLELAWKRIRLRCMVYSSLGDMEEDDEDRFMEQENLEIQGHEQASQVISPDVAIFLTSVLEYMGELTLTVAGQAACARVRSKIETDLRDGTRDASHMADRIVVCDTDMERVAIDRTLGRLWRGWKKRMRFPNLDAASRPFSRSSAAHPSLPENPMFPSERLVFKSAASMSDSTSQRTKSQASTESEAAKDVDPSHIPLPLGDNDVNEIEVPGLAFNSDDEQTDVGDEEISPGLLRPKSLTLHPYAVVVNGTATPSMSQPQTPVVATRQRSWSLPTPATSPTHRHRARKAAAQAAAQLGNNNVVEPEASALKKEDVVDEQVAEPVNQEAHEMDKMHDAETMGVSSDRKREAEEAALWQDAEEAKAETPALTSEEAKADTPSLTPEEAKTEPIALAAEEASAEPRDLTPEEASVGTAALTPKEASAETSDLAREGASAETSDLAREGASAETSPDSTREEAAESAASTSTAAAGEKIKRKPIAVSSLAAASAVGLTATAVTLGRVKSGGTDNNGDGAALARGGSNGAASRPSVSSTLTSVSSASNHTGSNYSDASSGREKAASSTMAAQVADTSGPPRGHGVFGHGAVPPIATDRTRSVSSSGMSSLTMSSGAEEENQTKLSTPTRPTARPLPRSASAASMSYAKSSPRQTPSPTSQPDQDADSRSHRASESSIEVLGSRGAADQAARQPMRRKAPSSAGKREASSHAAVTPPRSGKSGSISEDVIPEVPPKASGASSRHSPRSDSRAERSRTHSTDDEHDTAAHHSNMTSRQIHTSASSASSATSRLKPVRTSEDGSSRADSVARNFEQLIQSNETITFTLTPENMRDLNAAKRPLDSPVVTKHASGMSDEFRGPHSPRASPTVLPEAPKSPSLRQSTSLSSRRGTEPNRTSQQSAATSRAPRTGASLAREARSTGESTLQMADFLKATGPAPGEQIPSPRQQFSIPASPTKALGFPARRHFQPREAVADTNADSADLIDFIRQGPPASPSGHRIPRHVAPFRNTIDSEHLVGVSGGRAVDATIPEIRYSQGSTNMTDNSMPSMQSSINSNTALINKSKGAAASGKAYDDDDGGVPKRKQRRVRDPYAIDLSDEEADYGISTTPRPAAKREESLAEFLRNYDPPPEPASVPAQLPRRKASAPSLIGRLTRGSGKDAKDPNGSPAIPKSAVAAASRQDARSSAIRPGGRAGYIPIQVNMPPGYENRYGAGYDSRHGMGGDVAPAPSRMASSAASSGHKVPMKKFEPREPVVNRSQTADLAAFLRDSGPPDVPRASPVPGLRESVRHDDAGSVPKRFGRKKRS